MTQLTRNYLKMEQGMDQSKITKRNEDGSKNSNFNGFCYAKYTAIKRKNARFYSRGRKFYCRIVANEDWCAKNVEYTLPERVKNGNKKQNGLKN